MAPQQGVRARDQNRAILAFVLCEDLQDDCADIPDSWRLLSAAATPQRGLRGLQPVIGAPPTPAGPCLVLSADWGDYHVGWSAPKHLPRSLALLSVMLE
ncbi:MAG: hypothetical protein ABI137_03675 [Antricoccus sp.]